MLEPSSLFWLSWREKAWAWGTLLTLEVAILLFIYICWHLSSQTLIYLPFPSRLPLADMWLVEGGKQKRQAFLDSVPLGWPGVRTKAGFLSAQSSLGQLTHVKHLPFSSSCRCHLNDWRTGCQLFHGNCLDLDFRPKRALTQPNP